MDFMQVKEKTNDLVDRIEAISKARQHKYRLEEQLAEAAKSLEELELGFNQTLAAVATASNGYLNKRKSSKTIMPKEAAAQKILLFLNQNKGKSFRTTEISDMCGTTQTMTLKVLREYAANETMPVEKIGNSSARRYVVP